MTCRCCHVPNAIFGPRRSFNDLPTNPHLACDLCLRHLGSDERSAKRRDEQHILMWQEYAREQLELLTEAKDAVIAARDTQLADLQTQLDERPVQIVTENLDLEQVQAAHDEVRQARRSRDFAFLDLSRVHMLHREMSGGRCRCSKPAQHCPAAEILDGSRALRRWENVQAERRRRGLSNMLPYDHPGTVDTAWEPDEVGMREFESGEEYNP